MKLNKMPKEELELYSYTDLSKMILEEKGKALNTPSIFREICDLLELSDDEYADKIGDYYTSLTTDKDFVLLSNGNWDLRDRHPVQVILDEDEIEEESLEEEELEEEEIVVMEDSTEEPESDDDLDLDEEDETGDLTIISEEDLEED